MGLQWRDSKVELGIDWEAEPAPVIVTDEQVAVIVGNCRSLISGSFPGADKSDLDQAVEIMYPSVIAAATSGRFDLDTAKRVGLQIREMMSSPVS